MFRELFRWLSNSLAGVSRSQVGERLQLAAPQRLRFSEHRMSASWCWAGARAIGTAHLAGGLPCQDAFAARVARAPCGSEVVVAALADGAGSAERADAGARLATSLSVEVAAEALADGAGSAQEAAPLLRYGAEQARFAIAALAEHETRSVADFASTLLLVVLHSDGGVVGPGSFTTRRWSRASASAPELGRLDPADR